MGAKFIINGLPFLDAGSAGREPLFLPQPHHVQTTFYRRRNPSELSGFFCQQRPHRCALQPPGACQRPHAHVHQQRHGAVQRRVFGHRQAPLRARSQRAGQLACGRQAQRPGKRGLHRAPPHLFRDAGQLELWRLLQAREHRMGLGATDPGLRPAARKVAGHRLSRRRRGL